MRAATLCLALLACLLAAVPASALEQRLVASDGATNDYLGWDVDVDGDTAVVGAVQAQSTSPGLAYVFTRTGDTWNQTARLQASDSQVGDRFGQAVAIDGDTIVVGAPRHIVNGNNAAGAVYTFDRTGAPNRTQTAKLTIAAPANTGGQLGSSVAIDGDVIVAGARADSSPALLSHGAVYTFTRTGAAQRTERSRLIASDREQGDQLGESVDIDGDTIVAGAWRKNGQSGPGFQRGTAYTFDATATGTDAETAKLVPTDASALDQFGFAVGIEGDTIVVSANRDSFTGRNYVGSAYTFARTGSGVRGQTGKLIASDGLSEDGFGFSVAVDGPTIAVGSYLDDNGTGVEDRDWGSVYTYARTSPQAERSELAKLRPADTARDDYAGFSVALDGDVMIVGSSGDDVGANLDQGSATIYFSPATGAACSDAADNDGDGKIDFPADPGCSGPDDTSEVDTPPGATPTPTPTPTPTATPTATPAGPVGPAPTPPATGSETPRIVRPRTQPPVVVKARVLKLFTIWECRPAPDGTPCKGLVKIVLGRFEDGRRAAAARTVTIGSGSATIANGARKQVAAKLSKKGAKLLRRRGRLGARAIVTLGRSGAEPARAVVPVTLKAPRPR